MNWGTHLIFNPMASLQSNPALESTNYVSSSKTLSSTVPEISVNTEQSVEGVSRYTAKTIS